ncbi:MAG: ThuA domain-containing protein [Halioglobus sp.]|nr:ThuA domain-containing protein [Halioglobus sp.]
MCRRLPLCLLLCIVAALFSTTVAIAAAPLRALIVTTQGVYHNYQEQTWILVHRISEHANVRFDVSLAELDRWKSADYAQGYDVLIYNFCLADSTDSALIANMRRQTEQLGVPAVVVHCSLHSFRDTPLWWPMLGLHTKAHAPLGAMTMTKSEPHPITQGMPQDWTLAADELYINLSFEGKPLLTSLGADGKDHVTAWLSYPGGTPVFGTTLGHSTDTINDPFYQLMLARALLYVTGNLREDGTPRVGMDGSSDGMDVIERLSAPQGITFLGEEGHDCAFRELAVAAAPCYIGCIFNPFQWNAETRACKKSCEADLPKTDELIRRCTESPQ